MFDLPLPLAGVRVLDLSRLLPGPYASWLLSTLGADVVKIEPPSVGDYARHSPPPIDGNSALFHVINRGKRSLAVDLKQSEGRDLVLDLVPSFDVVLDQFRPGVLTRLGLGPDVLLSRRSDLILCQLTGYGQEGPLAHKAGHDLNYQAQAGTLWMDGAPGGPPPVPGVPMADMMGSLHAVAAILAALVRRNSSGEGARLDISMTDSIAASASPITATWTGLGPMAPGRGEGLLSGGIAQYCVYQTACGGHLAVAALEPKFFARFAEAVGHPEWCSEAPLPGPHQTSLKAAVAEVVAGRTRDEWEELLAEVDCCVSPVLDPREAVDRPLFADRGLRAEESGPMGAAAWVESPLGPPLESCAPGLGADTEGLLQEFGVSTERIAELFKAGVVTGT